MYLWRHLRILPKVVCASASARLAGPAVCKSQPTAAGWRLAGPAIDAAEVDSHNEKVRQARLEAQEVDRQVHDYFEAVRDIVRGK